jgi:hypothetical protein
MAYTAPQTGRGTTNRRTITLLIMCWGEWRRRGPGKGEVTR